MKEKLFKATVAGLLLTGCAGDAKDTPPVPVPPTHTEQPTPVGTEIPVVDSEFQIFIEVTPFYIGSFNLNGSMTMPDVEDLQLPYELE